MHPRSPFSFLVVFLALLQGLPARGGPAAGQGKRENPARADRYGDPLPEGAVSRLGTERLTVGDAVFLTFSPDGRHLAAHNGSEGLRVWDVASGKELLRLKTPRFGSYGAGMSPLAFSPDGKALALGCEDQTARVWEVATGKEVYHFGGLRGRMTHLAFSPGGRSLVAGGYGGPALCWDLSGGGPPRTIGNFPSVAFLALSRDGKTLTASTGNPRDWRERTFVRWELATGKEVGRHSFATAGRWACSLSPEGGTFAAPDADGKSIALLDPLTGRERGRAQGSDYPALISFSRDGTAVTCSSRDGTARVWDATTGKLRARFKALPTGFNWVALSPDGKLLALSGRADQAVHVWDVAARRELHSFVGHRGGPLAVAFLGGGREVATVSRDGSHVGPFVREWAAWSFRRWDPSTGAERAATSHNPEGEVHLTAFSADGRRLVAVTHDGTLRLWDVEAGKHLRSWKAPTLETTTTLNDGKGGRRVVKTPRPAISRPAFTPDNQILLAAEGPTVRRWEVATGKELPAWKIEGATEPATSCAPSPDGRMLAVWG
jgi:WD40 repeat protein